MAGRRSLERLPHRGAIEPQVGLRGGDPMHARSRAAREHGDARDRVVLVLREQVRMLGPERMLLRDEAQRPRGVRREDHRVLGRVGSEGVVNGLSRSAHELGRLLRGGADRVRVAEHGVREHRGVVVNLARRVEPCARVVEVDGARGVQAGELGRAQIVEVRRGVARPRGAERLPRGLGNSLVRRHGYLAPRPT
jgi:hypothetical protein